MRVTGAVGLHCESLCEERPPLPVALFGAISIRSRPELLTLTQASLTSPHIPQLHSHLCQGQGVLTAAPLDLEIDSWTWR